MTDDEIRRWKRQPFGVDLTDPEMIQARRRLADQAEAQAKARAKTENEVEDHFGPRMQQAREAAGPGEIVGYFFTPNAKTHRFDVVAIRNEDLQPKQKNQSG